MRRLIPEPGETSVDELLGDYRPFDHPLPERPFVAANMITTLDGRASIDGRSKELGGDTDSELLIKLRHRFEAVMIGGGTMRAERYGRIIRDPEARARREQLGLAPDPLAVILSSSLDLPFDAPLFTSGGGRVLIFTDSELGLPETATKVQVVRSDGPPAIREVLRHLGQEQGIRAVLCEGGPQLLGLLVAADAVDELFLTSTPIMVGGDGSPRILEGVLTDVRAFELSELLEESGELFARYRPRR